jgi:hypothetical protein
MQCQAYQSIRYLAPSLNVPVNVCVFPVSVPLRQLTHSYASTQLGATFFRLLADDVLLLFSMSPSRHRILTD